MSALGQKRTWQRILLMSALPPKADIDLARRDVRFVPKGDILRCGRVRPAPDSASGHERWQEARSAPYTDCLGEYRLDVTGQRSSRPTPYNPLSAYLLF